LEILPAFAELVDVGAVCPVQDVKKLLIAPKSIKGVIGNTGNVNVLA